jgi:hypothetical protein
MAATDRIPGDVGRRLAVAVQQYGNVPKIEDVSTGPDGV